MKHIVNTFIYKKTWGQTFHDVQDSNHSVHSDMVKFQHVIACEWQMCLIIVILHDLTSKFQPISHCKCHPLTYRDNILSELLNQFMCYTLSSSSICIIWHDKSFLKLQKDMMDYGSSRTNTFFVQNVRPHTLNVQVYKQILKRQC